MYTNLHNLPMSMVLWLMFDDYDYNSDSKTISATSILKPTKSLVLGSRVGQQEPVDVMNMVASRLGTAIHTAIEQAWLSDPAKVKELLKMVYPSKLIDAMVVNPDPDTVTEDDFAVYMEIRNDKQVSGYTISGKFDFICNGQLEDFKSTSAYTWVTQSNKEKYIQQGSIYRWLNPHLVTEDVMRINYIFTDWSAAKAKQSKDYPPSRILSQEYPLMSLAETEAFVMQRIAEIDRYMDAHQDEMPRCTPEELWEKPTVYKYYKNPAKKVRSTANFDSYWEAHDRYMKDGSIGEIVTIKGEVGFCKYCPASALCSQAAEMMAEGRLTL